MARQIVVVEDEPLVRMDAVSMLENTGMEVVEFDRADDALKYCRKHIDEVAAVFTDVNLHGAMDGIDLAQEVSHTAPDTVILVTTSRMEDRPAGLPPNASFLPKPWTAAEVLHSLNLQAS